MRPAVLRSAPILSLALILPLALSAAPVSAAGTAASSSDSSLPRAPEPAPGLLQVDPLEVDPLAVTDEMREYVLARVPSGFKPSDRLSALMDAIFAHGTKGLGVEYGDHETRTAAETFERRSGNCISFANLLVALAREVGLTVYFAEVDEVLTRDQRGETLINNRHMVVEVEIENAMLQVDLAPGTEDSYRTVRRIPDRRAAAHYFNNLGVERLIEDGAFAALPWFERALDLAPDFAAGWVNLGVALRRRGRFEDAEKAYRQAIELDHAELAAFSNLAYLYEAWGREAEAAALHDRVGRYRRRNPFRAFRRGQAAVEAGALDEAVEQFHDAARRAPEEARFHFALGDALYRSGELEKARQSLERALKLAESDEEREHYRSALDAVSSLLAAGVVPVRGSPAGPPPEERGGG